MFTIYHYMSIYFFFYSFFIVNSFLLHFPTLISSFDPLLFFNFVIPISPAAFYYNFKYYPYWPLKSSEKQTPRVSEVSRELKSLLSLLLCQLQHYGFSWNRCIWVSSKLLKLQWTFHLLTNDMAASTSSSLFDIIVTMYYHRCSHQRHCH